MILGSATGGAHASGPLDTVTFSFSSFDGTATSGGSVAGSATAADGDDVAIELVEPADAVVTAA
jgi:hypothetical protein